MNKQPFFERNLLPLSVKDGGLCSRLSAAETTLHRYRFLEARSGEIVPAIIAQDGNAHPLHSMVDPRREAARLLDSVKDAGCLVFMGLGGGFFPAAALEREDVRYVLVIDYDINGVAELLCSREYTSIFKDPRFSILVDAPPALIEKRLLASYQPVLQDGIRVLPIRNRIIFETDKFSAAGTAVEGAIACISADYSVQAYFGTRWFSNIIRNLFNIEDNIRPFPSIKHAAVSAAGPSLDIQIPRLKAKQQTTFIIAADTSLNSLVNAGIRAHAVISIDCQHYSCYHFMNGMPEIPLFLDIASPPLLAAMTGRKFFFAGGHPLAAYVSRFWRSFPWVDTSGGNVTYAAVSLAECLGAEEIELYGADFSYPLGWTYTRGAYLFPSFAQKQKRLLPLETLHSDLLYRTPLTKQEGKDGGFYYETPAMCMYRERLEEKSALLRAELIPIPGMGAAVNLRMKQGRGGENFFPVLAWGKPSMSAEDFLEGYRAKIRALPLPRNSVSAWLEKLKPEESLVLATLIPEAAAVKRRSPELKTGPLIDAAAAYCCMEIEKVLNAVKVERQ
ncbi:MAG: DUF115 domain-containing protein [Treponema sp.]|nr:DUF115 domain-containing protein [Treponema sp.]